jgi:hypothetical protein
LPAVSVQAQVTLADIRGDYGTTGVPLPDTFGTGTWNYFASTTQNPASGTLTQLIYSADVFGDDSKIGYAHPTNRDAGFALPAIASTRIFSDGATPGGTQLAWHAGDFLYTVIRWTAGTGEAGPIQITGALSRVGEPILGTADFSIYVNGVQAFDLATTVSGNSYGFDFASTIVTSQSVDFVVGRGASFGGNEALISGTISSIPEPTSYAALAGLTMLGFVLWRRRVGRRV